MIGIPVQSVLSSDWHFQSALFSHPVPDLPLDKTYPTWGTRRVFVHVSGFGFFPFRRRIHAPTPSG